MSAKTPLILAFIASLFFVAQAHPRPVRVEMKQGGGCAAAMPCARGCCANIACCKKSEQQPVPGAPAPAPRQTDIHIAPIGLHTCALLSIPPAPRRAFVILDDASTAHTLAPLAVSCIRLI